MAPVSWTAGKLPITISSELDRHDHDHPSLSLSFDHMFTACDALCRTKTHFLGTCFLTGRYHCIVWSDRTSWILWKWPPQTNLLGTCSLTGMRYHCIVEYPFESGYQKAATTEEPLWYLLLSPWQAWGIIALLNTPLKAATRERPPQSPWQAWARAGCQQLIHWLTPFNPPASYLISEAMLGKSHIQWSIPHTTTRLSRLFNRHNLTIRCRTWWHSTWVSCITRKILALNVIVQSAVWARLHPHWSFGSHTVLNGVNGETATGRCEVVAGICFRYFRIPPKPSSFGIRDVNRII